MNDSSNDNGRRAALKGGVALGAGLAMPTFFMRNAWAQDFRNNPASKKSIMLGFNVPQTGPYADEGADELKAFKLAAKHLEHDRPLRGSFDGFIDREHDEAVDAAPVAAHLRPHFCHGAEHDRLRFHRERAQFRRNDDRRVE